MFLIHSDSWAGFWGERGFNFCLAIALTVIAAGELQAQTPTPTPTATPSATPASRLGNISTRAFVQIGDDVMIGGFIVQGTEAKRVIIRAIGPKLGQYGVPDFLADPTLELHDGTGALIGSNDYCGPATWQLHRDRARQKHHHWGCCGRSVRSGLISPQSAPIGARLGCADN